MQLGRSVQFFEQQFQAQSLQGDFQLNPFEQAALPHVRGKVLDFGCGLGNLALLAAEQGCEVLALDASPTAIAHLQARAHAADLPLRAMQADLRNWEMAEDFDTVLCIGLLMFFDCATARATLLRLQQHTRPGGVAVVNVLIDGTTYLDMFDPREHCLFDREELQTCFAGWTLLHTDCSEFEAPGATRKRFATIIARKPTA